MFGRNVSQRGGVCPSCDPADHIYFIGSMRFPRRRANNQDRPGFYNRYRKDFRGGAFPKSMDRFIRMGVEENFTDLIGGIYDATLDATLWSPVLARAAEFVGGSAAALFSKDPAGDSGDVYYQVGIDSYYQKLYFDKYVSLDPTTTGHFFAEVEQPVAIADFMPYDRFLETRFYREWVQPQGLVDFVSAALEKSMTSVAMFGVFRHERDGIVDDEARRRMRLILPHIRRAVLIGRLFKLEQAEAASFADILDGLSAGMFLVDGRGAIVHANRAARAFLDDSDFLSSIGGRLTARDPHVDRALRDVFAAADLGDAEIGVKGIAVPLSARTGLGYVAHVLPLTSGDRRRAGIAYAAAAAVFVRKAALETPSPPEVIAKAYNLTPSELRVLHAIVEVGGVPEVAAALGIAVTTVKTHLARLFEKTGAKRQADLVKLVAGFSGLLVG
jgi:DNA-binding CsgD family transcriptional regulator/PAS domain-containing protein